MAQNTGLDWLEDKRTCCKFYTFPDKLGHQPQDDYPERVAELIENFVEGRQYNQRGALKRTGDSTL